MPIEHTTERRVCPRWEVLPDDHGILISSLSTLLGEHAGVAAASVAAQPARYSEEQLIALGLSGQYLHDVPFPLYPLETSQTAANHPFVVTVVDRKTSSHFRLVDRRIERGFPQAAQYWRRR